MSIVLLISNDPFVIVILLKIPRFLSTSLQSSGWETFLVCRRLDGEGGDGGIYGVREKRNLLLLKNRVTKC